MKLWLDEVNWALFGVRLAAASDERCDIPIDLEALELTHSLRQVILTKIQQRSSTFAAKHSASVPRGAFFVVRPTAALLESPDSA